MCNDLMSENHCWQTESQQSRILIFCWTTFSCDYRTQSPWHRFEKIMHCHNFNFHPQLHSFLPRSYIDNGRIGPLHKVFSSTSQRFSVRFRVLLRVDSLCVMSHASSPNPRLFAFRW